MTIVRKACRTFCVAGVVLLGACATPASFTSKTPVSLTPVEHASATLQVSNWSDSQSLTVMNGGPYAENTILMPVEVRFVKNINRHTLAIDANSDLHIIDFNVNPAKQLAQLTVDNEITSIDTRGNDIFVGFRDIGVFQYRVSENGKSVKKQKLVSTPGVSRVKVYKESLYYLAGKNTLYSIPLDELNTANNSSIAQWGLPTACHDFAVMDDVFALLTDSGLGIVGKQNTAVFESTLGLQGSKQQITLQDNTAIIADGDGGMVLVDLQDRIHPRWIGSHNKLGAIHKVLARNDKAYVIDRDVRLASISLANHELPITDSFYKPEGQVNDLALGKDAVYLATSNSVEKVIFPDVTHGQISNEGVNQGGTRRAFVADNLAYVADWFSGLHIYDVSDPKHPRHIGNFHTPGSSKGVVVDNGYAYVGDDDHGLQIIDVHNPEKPIAVGHVQTTGLAYTLKKRGDLVFLADHRGGFHIINVADVSNPKIVSSHNTNGKSWAIDVKGNIAYVADDNSGLLVFDISNIKKPVQIAQFNPGGFAEDVAVRDNIAYVSFFDRGFYLLDISNPAKPALISHLDIPGNARSVVLQGQYAYIAGWESGLQVVDVSNAHAPKITGSFDTRGSAWGADIHGNHVYVWDWWGGVKIINVTDPAKPVLESQYHANSKIDRLRQKNNFIYTANHAAGIQVFDVNNVLNPIWTTGIDIPGNVSDVWPVQDAGFLLAVSDAEDLIVLDISDPFYIKKVSNYQLDGNANIVREYNGRIYVATDSGELHVFDASNYEKLSLISTLKISVLDLWVDRQTLFIASSDEGLVAFSLKADGNISHKKQLISDIAHNLTASNRFLVVATDNNELNIWKRPIDGISPLMTIDVNDRILSTVLNGSDLLVLTARRGLLHYAINNSKVPYLVGRYPLTDNYNDILLHHNAVFFAGQDTIASVQLLPKLSVTSIDSQDIKISVDGKLPVGSYHLAITDPKGHENFWPNALSVKLKTSGKPRLSIEDFQKLLQQHRKNQ